MSDTKNQDDERTRQEARIEDLPVDESTTEQVKGGPFDGIAGKPGG